MSSKSIHSITEMITIMIIEVMQFCKIWSNFKKYA